MVFDYDICLILEFLLYISSCFRVFVDSDRFWTTFEILDQSGVWRELELKNWSQDMYLKEQTEGCFKKIARITILAQIFLVFARNSWFMFRLILTILKLLFRLLSNLSYRALKRKVRSRLENKISNSDIIHAVYSDYALYFTDHVWINHLIDLNDELLDWFVSVILCIFCLFKVQNKVKKLRNGGIYIILFKKYFAWY